MAERTYTQEQMDSAERLMDVIASVAADKQPEIIRMVEAMILGAEMAERLNSSAESA